MKDGHLIVTGEVWIMFFGEDELMIALEDEVPAKEEEDILVLVCVVLFAACF